MKLPIASAVLLVAACSPSPSSREDGAAPAGPPRAEQPLRPARPPTLTEPKPAAALVGQTVAVAEWRKAANRASCAPLALGGGGGAPATARRAQYSQGWGVAFDRPGLRSAYGFAGSGLLPEDQADFAVKVAALAEQWPYVRRWDAGENLPPGAAAGYGLAGARPYSEDNPDGRGAQSLAYLRIPGQQCMYNVWSRLGRAHLETLLGQLRIVAP